MSITFDEVKFGKPKRSRKGVWLSCETCKREFYVVPARLKLGMVKYCSKKCYKTDGENNPMWGKKHKVITKKAWKNNPLRNRFKPGVDNPNFIRFAGDDFWGASYPWWQHNKAKRTKICERCPFDNLNILVVHHKDRNRRNNSIENIEILCPNCHALEHFNKKDGPWHNLK